MSKIELVGSEEACKELKVDKVGLHWIRKSGLIPFQTVGTRTHLYDLNKIRQVREFAQKLSKC